MTTAQDYRNVRNVGGGPIDKKTMDGAHASHSRKMHACGVVPQNVSGEDREMRIGETATTCA